MYSLVFYLPLILLSVIILFSRYLGSIYISYFVVFITLSFFFISLLILYEVCLCGVTCNIVIFNWFSVDTLNITFEFFFDSISSIMFFIIIFISLCVFIYSIEYMSADPFFIRFIFYLVLFMFFMLILIFSTNFIQLFLGWEGVGLVSYLLINFWYSRIEANRSAIKALLLNKVGDCGLYISIVLVYFVFKTLDFNIIFSLIPYTYNFNPYIYIYSGVWYHNIDVICFFLVIAVIGKSAQLGLHIWLSDAMEGPTPVSALLHAATMVTAGVFLLIRLSPLFEFSNILVFIILIGGLTTFVSSLIGISQFDIKKIIAYSTCSQLGYMIFSCGCSNYHAALFHLFNHAFFKALLFLLSGAFILIFNGEQDIRKIYLNPVFFPYYYLLLNLASSSLTGVFFFSGFYSKEIILELTYSSFTLSSYFIYWLGLLAVFCTCFYSLKLSIIIFFSSNNFYYKYYRNIINFYEPKFFMNLILFILAIFSLISGYFFKDLFVDSGSFFILSDIFISNNNDVYNIFEFLPFYIRVLPSIITICTFFLGYYSLVYCTNSSFFVLLILPIINKILYFFKKKIYFDLIFFYFTELFLFFIYDFLLKFIDKNVFEFLGPRGLIFFFKNLFYRLLQIKNNGFLLTYFTSIFLNMIFLFIFFFLFLCISYQLLILISFIYLYIYLYIYWDGE